VYETGVMGLTPPISGTVTGAIRGRESVSTTCLVPDEASLMHLAC